MQSSDLRPEKLRRRVHTYHYQTCEHVTPGREVPQQLQARSGPAAAEEVWARQVNTSQLQTHQ